MAKSKHDEEKLRRIQKVLDTFEFYSEGGVRRHPDEKELEEARVLMKEVLGDVPPTKASKLKHFVVSRQDQHWIEVQALTSTAALRWANERPSQWRIRHGENKVVEVDAPTTGTW